MQKICFCDHQHSRKKQVERILEKEKKVGFKCKDLLNVNNLIKFMERNRLQMQIFKTNRVLGSLGNHSLFLVLKFECAVSKQAINVATSNDHITVIPQNLGAICFLSPMITLKE